MKRIGVIGAMALEIELLKNNININTSKNIAGFDFFLGDIDNKDVII